MKDITHYFPDNVKSYEINPTDSTSSAKLKNATEYSSKKKRARVKIKISGINSKNGVCNIIESKNDLIDKTPSPFTKIFKENEAAAYNETPKKPSEILHIDPNETEYEENFEKKEEKVLKNTDLNHVLIELDNEPEIIEHKVNGQLHLKMSLDKQNTNEGKVECNLKNCSTFKYNTAHNNDTKINKKWTEVDVYELVSQHKESNAFHVLMNRNKTVNYISPVHSLLKNDVFSESVKNESNTKLKQCKSKVLAFVNKKNYSKRKVREMEEGDKMEEILEKRMKLFTDHTNIHNNNSVIINDQNNTSNNLLQFFSKTPIELEQEDTIKVSTVVVKADVHMSDISTVNSVIGTVTPMSDFENEITHMSQTKFSNIDNVDVITSEEIKQEQTMAGNLQSLKQNNKSKWSLRIKLQSSEGNGQTMFSSRSKTKLNAEDKKLYEKLHGNNEKKYASECTTSHLKKKEQINEPGNRYNKDSSCPFNGTMQKNIQENILIKESLNQVTDIENVEKYRNNNKIDITIKNNIGYSPTMYDYILREKRHKKLAPLFIKPFKPNTATATAQHKYTEKKKNDYNGTFLSFPKISHITQLNKKVQINDKLNILKIRMKSETKYIPQLNYNNFKCTSLSTKLPNNLQVNVGVLVENNMEEVLTEMEQCCPDTRSIWRTVLTAAKGQSYITQLRRSKNKKRKSTGKEITIRQNEEEEFKNSIWIHKYKPMNSQQIVGNEEAALQLKNWLIRWRSTLNKETSSSGDEFYSSDCSYTSKNENNQVAVLLGPYGSGKTASVYAVAEELGYSVLEVNASSRRTGKKILKEFEEATKSHRIENKEIKLPIPISKEVKNLPQNSLILLEDIDLIFEEDEGFISAASQLVSNTKRPIVITCRDVCSYLNKIAPEQNKIYFQKAIGNRVSTLLELISLAETGFRLSCECLAELLQNGDLRKALLQLQYLLVSGFTHINKHSFNLKGIIWQDMRNYLYKPAIKENKKQKAKSHLKNKINNNTNVTDILTTLATNLDNLSLLPSLIEINDPALDVTYTKVEPSLSLIEDATTYSILQNISLEIAEWIDQEIIYKGHLIGKDRIQYQTTLSLKKQLNKGVNITLSKITSWTLDNRSVSVDYLPCIRTICRAEECRAESKSKRGNRFFHYLNGLKWPASSIKQNILTVASKMLHEKSVNIIS